jgi:hypothetical protein
MFNKLLQHSRFTLSLIEIWCGIYLLLNSVTPLIDGQRDSFIPPTNDQSPLQEFLNGTGILTSGFWIRIVAIFVGLAMIILPFWGCRFLKARAILDYAAFILFTYVGVLIVIYVPLDEFFWLAPLASGLLCAAVYLGNKADLRARTCDDGG